MAFCKENPKMFYPNLQSVGDLLKIEGEGADIMVYWAMFCYHVPCMYCGCEDGICEDFVTNTPYRILFCHKCITLARQDMKKVEHMFVLWREKQAKEKQSKLLAAAAVEVPTPAYAEAAAACLAANDSAAAAGEAASVAGEAGVAGVAAGNAEESQA